MDGFLMSDGYIYPARHLPFKRLRMQRFASRVFPTLKVQLTVAMFRRCLWCRSLAQQKPKSGLQTHQGAFCRDPRTRVQSEGTFESQA